MSSLDFIGATEPAAFSDHPVAPLAITIGAGVVGAALWRAHPVLGFLGASGLASNAHGYASSRLTLKQTGVNVGQHLAAVAGSLALGSHPAIGYVAGMLAADLILDGRSTAAANEWTQRSGIAGVEPELIDIATVS